MGNEPNRRVAIVAVHGVGDHPPGETARQIAEFLIQHDRKRGQSQYTPLIDEDIEIPIKPVRDEHPFVSKDKKGVVKVVTEAPLSRLQGAFNERPDYMVALQRGEKLITKDDGTERDVDHDVTFIKQRLMDYKDPEHPNPYKTKRFCSKRKSAAGESEVDIYEMYWDDISRVGQGPLAILGELYQILFHLPSIGRKTLDFARVDNDNHWVWKLLSWFYAAGARFLTLPIVVLNLILLAVFLTTLSGIVGQGTMPYVAWGFVAGLILVAFGAVMLRWPAARPLWFLALILAIGIGLSPRYYGSSESMPQEGLGYYHFLAFELLTVLSAVAAWVLLRYDTLRKGAAITGLLLGLPLLVFFVTELLKAKNTHAGITQAAFHVAEVVFLLLVLSWFSYILLVWITGFFALFVQARGWFMPQTALKDKTEDKTEDKESPGKVVKVSPKERAIRSARALFTARLALAISTTGFLAVLIVFYAALARVAPSFLPREASYQAMLSGPVLSPLLQFNRPYAWLHTSDITAPGRLVADLRHMVEASESGQDVGYLDAPLARAGELMPRSLAVAARKYDGSEQQNEELVKELNKVLETVAKSESQIQGGQGRPKEKPSLEKPLSTFLKEWAQWKEAVPATIEKTAAPSAGSDSAKVARDMASEVGRADLEVRSYDLALNKARALLDKATVGLVSPLGARFRSANDDPTKQNSLYPVELTERMFALTATPALRPAVYLLIIAAIIAVWGLLPSLLTEALPAWADRFNSRAHGAWMSSALWALRVSGEFVFLGVLVLIPASSIALSIATQIQGGPAWLTQAIKTIEDSLPGSMDLVKALGVAVVASATSLVALRGQLQKLTLGLRTPLQASLDVDSWMRESPKEGTISARICARYISVLRALCGKEQPMDGTGYGAIVIVAHSQGTVITASLARYLSWYPHRRKELDLEDLGRTVPVYFMSAGSPLQQLYALRFPHLYNWAGGVAAGVAPDPSQLGVVHWVNAYRSGDYIGRLFWSANRPGGGFEKCPDASNVEIDDTRSEICVGAGAHTHYFDRHAPVVAEILDQLIEKAVLYTGSHQPKGGSSPP
jgi:hypothetical protein